MCDLMHTFFASHIGCTMTLTPPSVWSQGVGRRYAHVVLRKADIDLSKRAGELSDEEVRRAWRLSQVLANVKLPGTVIVGVKMGISLDGDYLELLKASRLYGRISSSHRDLNC